MMSLIEAVIILRQIHKGVNILTLASKSGACTYISEARYSGMQRCLARSASCMQMFLSAWSVHCNRNGRSARDLWPVLHI